MFNHSFRGRSSGHAPISSRRLRRFLATGLLAGSALAPATAWAQDWNGSVSTDWQNGANWSTGNPPASNGDVTVATSTGNQPVLDNAAVTVHSLSIASFVSPAQNASLRVQNAAKLRVIGTLSAGGSAISAGSLTADGAGTTVDTDVLIIGGSGIGGLTVQNGAQVTGNQIEFGKNGAGSGRGTVTGAGSMLTSTGVIYIGNLGDGDLTLSQGGQVSDQYAIIANGAGSTGSANVSGAGTHWQHADSFTVGLAGKASLNVSAGATIDVGNFGFFVGSDTSGSGTVRIDGAGTAINSAGQILVGGLGTGNLRVQNGAKLTGTFGMIGANGGGVGTVDVIGAGSLWQAGQALTVGSDGNGTLNILAGGHVTSVSGSIGSSFTDNRVTIDGTGSSWVNTGALTIGSKGLGTLVASNGASLVAKSITVGTTAAAFGTFKLSGSGTGALTGDMILGDAGQGLLSIQSGAGLGATNLTVSNQNSAGGSIMVDGAGSNLQVASQFVLGFQGDGQLSVTNGGSVIASNATTFGSIASAGVTIDGAGSNVNLGNLAILGDAGIADVEVTNGGAFSGRTVQLGYSPSGIGILHIDGAGSTATFGTAIAGIGGTARIIVSNGGALTVTGANAIGLELGQDPSAQATLNIGGDLNSAAAAPGSVVAPQILFGNGTGTLVFNHTANTYDFATPINGPGTILALSGTTTLTGDSSGFTGTLWVASNSGGSSTVMLNGTLGGIVNVGGSAGMAGFGGSGTATGAVAIDTNGTLYGRDGQTLTMGSLLLLSGATTDVTLGASNNSALFNVIGNLTLDGTLNVTGTGAFGPGLYRLFSYGGTLTDNGLDIGTVSTGLVTDYKVQTSVTGQVNLIYGGGALRDFWDGGAPGSAGNGVIDGGSGIWSVVSPNFTDSSGFATGPMAPQPGFVVFAGAPGTVTVDDSAGAVSVTGMQFATNGYMLQGDPITLADPQSIFRVGDGTSAGANITAVITAPLIGAGGLEKTDLGTLILAGANTYSGGTRVSSGRLIGNSVTLQGAIVDDATMIFNQTANGDFAGSLSGSGVLRKSGGGRLGLTGDTAGFTGSVFVDGGLLAVNSSLGSAGVTVADGGTIGGNGTIGSLLVQTGGTVAPGNSIGTLHIAGGVTFQPGSAYTVEVNGATGASDLIAAGGVAKLAGQVNVIGGGYHYGEVFHILTAQSLTGKFDGIATTGLSTPFQAPSLVYGTNSVDFVIDVDRTGLGNAGVTANEKAAAGAVAQLPGGNAVLGAFANSSVAQAVAGFDQVSGEIHAQVPRQAFEEARMIRDAVSARAQNASGSGLWIEGLGSWGATPGNGNYARQHRHSYGIAGGADVTLGSNGHAGVAVGYTDGGLSLDNRPGTADDAMVQLAAFAGTRAGKLNLSGGVDYGWGHVDTRRDVTLGNFGATLTAHYRLNIAQAFGEVGYAGKLGQMRLEPFANLTALSIHSNAFTETAGAAALQGAARTHEIQLTTLGLHTSTTGTGPVSLAVTAGWRHAFGATAPAANLAFAGSPSFEVLGAEVGRDAATVQAAARFRLAPRVSLSAGYSGAFGEGQDHSATATLSVAF